MPRERKLDWEKARKLYEQGSSTFAGRNKKVVY